MKSGDKPQNQDAISDALVRNNANPKTIIVCPRDGTVLNQKMNGNMRVWVCPTCSGLWLPAGTFHADVGQVSVIGRGRPSGISCPQDGHTLTAVIHRGIEIDVFGSCGGIGFDRGEIEKILAQAKKPSIQYLDDTAGFRISDVAGVAVDVVSGADAAGEIISAVFEFHGELIP